MFFLYTVRCAEFVLRGNNVHQTRNARNNNNTWSTFFCSSTSKYTYSGLGHEYKIVSKRSKWKLDSRRFVPWVTSYQQTTHHVSFSHTACMMLEKKHLLGQRKVMISDFTPEIHFCSFVSGVQKNHRATYHMIGNTLLVETVWFHFASECNGTVSQRKAVRLVTRNYSVEGSLHT